MKKLLFVIPTLSGGGAERFVSNLSNHLAKKNYEICILIFEDMKPYYDLDEKILVKSLGCKVERGSRFKARLQIAWNILYRTVKFVRKEIKSFQPDVVMPFLPQADISCYLASSKRRKYKLICSERNDPNERFWAVRKILGYIYKKSDMLVCQSNKVVDYYQSVDESKKVVIANPVDPRIIPSFVSTESSPRIVSAGRLDFQKNYSLLINAFADAYPFLPKDTSLTIYGEGPERSQLEKLAVKKKMNNNIHFPGLSNNLLNEISDAALFVLCSDFEGFPNALLEAMVVGLPVISTDFRTGTARTLIGEMNGSIIPVGDQHKLCETIIEYMSDKSKRTKIRLNNRMLLEKYSVNTIAQKWESLFE